MVDSADNPAITFTWSIPFEGGGGLDVASYRAAKPLVALAHLVAHQGPGSLSSWLQQKGYLPDNLGPKVTAQSPFSTENFAIWELKIKLSPDGLKHWTKVALCVFALLAALKQRYLRGVGTSPRRDVLRQAVDEVSALADIAWRFPPRPPRASELATDMRTAPRPAAYVFASRRIYAEGEWKENGKKDWEETRAARFTSSRAQEEAAETVEKVLKFLVPERVRINLWSTVPQANAQRRRDANLELEFSELTVDPKLQKEWLAAGPADWCFAPALNVYLSRADRVITKAPALADPQIPESIKRPKQGFNGVFWSEACRARLVEPILSDKVQIPRALWVVPGCVYVSGQFNELVEPLGDEPVVTLTLWMPAPCILDASLQSRAAGRMWLKSLQSTLESPFFGAALAGCRWECAFFTTSPTEAGVRLSFQAFSDNLPLFAVDAAEAIGSHGGPETREELERVRRMALVEVKPRDAKDLKSSLEKVKANDIQEESKRLWQSISDSVSTSQALVAGAISEEEAARLVAKVVAQLPIAIATTPSSESLELGARPAAVLTRRPSWQGPVAQSLCRASGLPALLDVCGRAMK